MYSILRRIHLFTGLILLVFVLMYFVSGYVMIHPNWFGERTSKESTRSEALKLPTEISDPALVAYLQETFGLRGQGTTPEHRKDGTIRVNFMRPGTAFQTVIDPSRTQIKITRRDFGFAGLANGMHRLKGYHGGWAYWIWSLLYDLASLALIIFGITGVVLWYQSSTKRLAGWLCLAVSFGFTSAMVLYLLFSR